MGWCIFAAVVLLLAILPLGVRLVYNSEGFFLWVLCGPVRIAILPAKKKKKKSPAKDKKPKPAPAKTEKPPQEKKRGGKLTDFLPFVRLATDFLGDFRRKLRLNNLVLHLTMAGEDPCDLGLNYARAWAALGGLMPLLENVFVIKKRDISVACDFEGSETVIFAQLDITVTLGRLLALAAVYGVRALKEFINLKNKRKGGTVK